MTNYNNGKKYFNNNQDSLFSDHSDSKFPSTRYQGSKNKLTNWISSIISELTFTSCLDAFGGTGSVSYLLKKMGKKVTYNDILKFNNLIGLALIENKNVTLSADDINWVGGRHDFYYPNLIQKNFHNIYFTESENAWLDQVITNLSFITDKYKYALAFSAVCQSCIIKRPYNLFHRKNLYVRLADVKRSFGNKISWDRPFEDWFRFFCDEINFSIFDNGFENESLNKNALDIQNKFDLVYIDTPYISKNGVALDYRDFYHFLEGLTFYDEWEKKIDFSSKHRRLLPEKNDWTDKKRIHKSFDNLFAHFKDSVLVISYRSDGIPSESELVGLLSKYKNNIRVEYYGKYKYALSKNTESKEILIVAY